MDETQGIFLPVSVSDNDIELETVETLEYGSKVALTPAEYVIVSRLDAMLICLMLLLGMSLVIFLTMRRK